MFCNSTSVWTAMWHFTWFLHHWNATDITILRQRRREDQNHNRSNNITSLFRLRSHIHLKIAKHMLTRAASTTIRCIWRHITSSAHAGHFRAVYSSHTRHLNDNVNNSGSDLQSMFLLLSHKPLFDPYSPLSRLVSLMHLLFVVLRGTTHYGVEGKLYPTAKTELLFWSETLSIAT